MLDENFHEVVSQENTGKQSTSHGSMFKENIDPITKRFSRHNTMELVKPEGSGSGNSRPALKSRNNTISKTFKVPAAPNDSIATPVKEDFTSLEEEFDIFATRYLVTPCNIPSATKSKKSDSENENKGVARPLYGSKRSRSRRGLKEIDNNSKY